MRSIAPVNVCGPQASARWSLAAGCCPRSLRPAVASREGVRVPSSRVQKLLSREQKLNGVTVVIFTMHNYDVHVSYDGPEGRLEWHSYTDGSLSLDLARLKAEHASRIELGFRLGLREGLTRRIVLRPSAESIQVHDVVSSTTWKVTSWTYSLAVFDDPWQAVTYLAECRLRPTIETPWCTIGLIKSSRGLIKSSRGLIKIAEARPSAPHRITGASPVELAEWYQSGCRSQASLESVCGPRGVEGDSGRDPMDGWCLPHIG